MDRLEDSASCQEARITSGTSTAISMSITSAMPSAANVKLTPQFGIQVYDSRNWNRSPPALKLTHITTESTSTSSDQTNATCLASSGRWRGRKATTRAPTSGATVSTERNGKLDIMRPYLRRGCVVRRRGRAYSGRSRQPPRLHRQERRHHQQRTGQDRGGVRADETGLQPPEPARTAADASGETVDQPVDAPVVEED